MSTPAVFLDKDGTLVQDVPYNVNPALIRFTKRAEEGLRLIHAGGFRLVVVSNQAGVARGFFSENDLKAVEDKLRELCARVGVPLEGFYCCPHHPAGSVRKYATTCFCRKPRPGLLIRASLDLGIDLATSWLIGDILDDVEAGRSAGCKTVMLLNGNETEWELSPTRFPHHFAANLFEAALIVTDRAVRKPARVIPSGNRASEPAAFREGRDQK